MAWTVVVVVVIALVVGFSFESWLTGVGSFVAMLIVVAASDWPPPPPSAKQDHMLRNPGGDRSTGDEAS